MDIREYVKIKKIPGGTPVDTEIIGGVVFTKNVVHRKMRTNITRPRILLLECSLEYPNSFPSYHIILDNDPLFDNV